jgi:hypothetical protein
VMKISSLVVVGDAVQSEVNPEQAWKGAF